MQCQIQDYGYWPKSAPKTAKLTSLIDFSFHTNTSILTFDQNFTVCEYSYLLITLNFKVHLIAR